MHNTPHTEESKLKMSLARSGKGLKWASLPQGEIVERLLSTAATTRSIAAEYGCSDSTIKNIFRRHTTLEQRRVVKVFKQGQSLRGYKHPEEFGARHSERMKGDKNPFFNKKHTDEFRQAQSLRKKGKRTSDLHRKAVSAALQNVSLAEWEGFRTDESKLARRTLEYKAWRVAVFERDNYTCRMCGLRGGTLHPHHIKTFAKHPELRYEISNGVTLCAEPCHRKTKGKEEEYEHLF